MALRIKGDDSYVDRMSNDINYMLRKIMGKQQFQGSVSHII
jgi:hypothetical protein